MGSGSYSISDRTTRAMNMGYTTKSSHEIFKSRHINNAMNPHGVEVRESRDSDEHPNSVAIILALDVTGSMGTVPHYLVKNGLPAIMDGIIKKGIADPQVLFMGIGDHECDEAPLQVGQFESSDELLDKWLTDLYLEGHGGGNDGESYHLAWYFAAKHTAIDCFEKRKQKGFLFTVGDEPVLGDVPSNFLKHMMGKGQFQNYSAAELLAEASKTYNVFHINICETASGSRKEVQAGWRELLSHNAIMAKKREDVASLITEIVTDFSGQSDSAVQKPSDKKPSSKKEEIIL